MLTPSQPQLKLQNLNKDLNIDKPSSSLMDSQQDHDIKKNSRRSDSKKKKLQYYDEESDSSQLDSHKHKKKKKNKQKKRKQSKKKSKKHKNKKSKKKLYKQLLDQIEIPDISDSDSDSLQLSEKMFKKKKKSKSKKQKRDPSRKKRIIRKQHKRKDRIVSASQDEGKPIELEEQSEQQEQKTQKKKRGRRPKALQTEQKKFDVDDVIDLQDQTEQKKSGRADPLSKRSRKKIQRLTKIKQPVIKNIIVTKNVQNVPVDHHFSKFNEVHVLQINGFFYNATLTQSNIVRDDNKFFIIQILQSNYNDDQFHVYSRWGRVGVTGQISELGPLNRQASIRHYNQVVQNKIKIGRYKVVEMNYDDFGDKKKDKGKKQYEIVSKLDPRIQELIKLIFDVRMMSSHMKEIGYDEKRLPLGKLASSSIREGYDMLNRLMDVVYDKEKESFEKKRAINELSGKFYQCIPHDFGYMNMQTFVLDTHEKIKEKLEILSSLEQIQIYNKILSEKFVDPELNELDQKFYRLGLKIEPVIKGCQIWKKLMKYVQNTHAKTHNKYQLEVQEIYHISREEDQVNYKNQLSNKMLLWHGSRLTNYVGILSKGLKVAPLEAPSTGYMFGKGVYFTDMVSKSANYCLATKINNTGLVLLCQVALGNIEEKYQADFNAAELPPGKNSIKGMGQTQPMGGQSHQGVWIPNGKAGPSGLVDAGLLYNEFVVYDPCQIKYRYLFRLKFHFKVTENILPHIRV